jgi:uncharacterized membrane protein
MQNDPPVQASPASPVSATKSSTGLDENVASLLAYLFNWVSGLIFFLIEKNSRMVRFHAMQSILLFGAIIVIGTVFWIVFFILGLIVGQISGLLATLFGLLSVLFSLVFVVLILGAWIFCMVKAYQGQYFKLPVIGNFAEKFSQK